MLMSRLDAVLPKRTAVCKLTNTANHIRLGSKGVGVPAKNLFLACRTRVTAAVALRSPPRTHSFCVALSIGHYFSSKPGRRGCSKSEWRCVHAEQLAAFERSERRFEQRLLCFSQVLAIHLSQKQTQRLCHRQVMSRRGGCTREQ